MDTEDTVPEQESQWFADLNPREQAQVIHAIDYAAHHSGAGVPGHGQFLLIARLAQWLDKYERRAAG